MKFSFDEGYFDTIKKEEFVKLHTKEPVYVIPGEPNSGIVHEGLTAEKAAELYDQHAPKKAEKTPAVK